MDFLTANVGSYPRVGDGPGQMRLRKAYRRWERGDVSEEKLEEIYRDYTEEVVEEQERAGLDVITDGQLRWYDPLSHFARGIEGCDIGGLLRYFDTNFYFRQPVINDELRWKGSILKEEFLSARSFTKETLRAVVTGPYTLAKYSINNHYKDFSELALDFAEVIGKEVKGLSSSGAKEIQINEPMVLEDRGDYEVFADTIEILSKSIDGSSLGLHVYFGDPVPLYDELQDLSVDFIGLDFTYSTRLTELIEEKGSEKPLGLGLINARNTKMEKPEEVESILGKIVPNISADKVYLNPSCGLEFLPRDRAYEKLERMVEIAERVRDRL